MLNITLIASLLFSGWNLSMPYTTVEHDFKLSVCEIVWSPEQEFFEVKFYIFQDDLKAGVYSDPNSSRLDATEVGPYVLKHFDLKFDGQELKLSYQSMQEKNDQVLLRFNSTKTRLGQHPKIQVISTLLTEKFRDQTNMVYVIFPNRPKQTQMLNASKTEGVFSL